jgi:hypothetical protein
LLAALALAPAARAAEVYVVSNPQDLRFNSLREPFTEVRSRFEGHVDLMDRLRRAAFKKLSEDWGIPPADKKDVKFGAVARTDSAGNLSYVLVLRGEIDPPQIQKKLVEQHKDLAKQRGVTSEPVAEKVQGKDVLRVPYLDRNVNFTLVPLDRMFVIAAAGKGDDTLLEEVLTVLKAPEKLGQGAPPTVVVEGKARFSEGDRKRVGEFQTRQIASPVKAIRDRFQKLHDKLSSSGAKPAQLKSLDERMTEQFLKASEFQIKMTYIPSPKEIYRGKYIMQYASKEEAQAMRELLLEKLLFFRDNAANPGIPRALDTVTVDAQGNAVTVRVELDTLQKRYDAAFSYIAFILSFAGADRALGIARSK